MPTKKITEQDVIKNNVDSKKTTYKTENVKRKISPLTSFIRLVSVLIILALVIVTGVFAYIIVNKEGDFSKWALNTTGLNKYLRLDNQNSGGESKESDGIANEILGLDTAADDVNFSFADRGQPLTVVEVVEQVLPSVLSISVASRNQSFQSISSGTGYIVSEDGLVITNKHVIANECSDFGDNISVTGMGNDQNAYELELLTVDPIEDLAILKIIDGDGSYNPVEFFDSDELKLGTEVVAIGNVLGQLQNTVTKGIVSGLNRSLGTALTDNCTGTSFSPESLIQTDAAINKGNSGGPLFESSGLLIGMNTFGAPDAQNIGLAIPSSRIKSALESYKSNGTIVRPRIGVFTRSIGPLERKENPWIPVDYGEIILSPNGRQAIEKDSAADKAGLKEGDIILAVNNKQIKSTDSNPSPLKNALLGYQKDKVVEVTVQKATGSKGGVFNYEKEPVKVSVKLGGVSIDLKNLDTIL